MTQRPAHTHAQHWNARYEQGTTPWDTGSPDPHLVAAVQDGSFVGKRVLEVGCGTGTNARFLAEQGRQVVGVDLASRALELARQGGGGVQYAEHDMTAGPPPGGPFDAVFDRGCFHIFDTPDQRAAFAANVAAVLAPGGLWLSLVGSTEGPPRDQGPPRRSARDILAAVEPELELLSLSRVWFMVMGERSAAWRGLYRKREVPAQPSSVHRRAGS